eukprot:12415554-Karenia_brevis.AAC.1
MTVVINCLRAYAGARGTVKGGILRVMAGYAHFLCNPEKHRGCTTGLCIAGTSTACTRDTKRHTQD